MANILCIEDEDLLRRDIALELEDAGHTVTEAADGVEGLEAILAKRPDLVLCDINMPRMDGRKLLTELRKNHPAAAELPFIFLTAFSDPKEMVSGLELGADDYLTKPINFDVLIAKVDATLRQVERMIAKKKQEQIKLYKTLKSEAEQAQPSSTVSNSAVHAFEAHMQRLQKQGVKSAASHLHFINFSDIKSRLGDRWETISNRAIDIAESILKSHLDQHETFIRHKDDAFFLLLPHLSAEEGQLKADALASKISERLLGEDSATFKSFQLAAKTVDVQQVADTSGNGGVSIETLSTSLEAVSGTPQTFTERFLSQISVRYQPLWSIQREAVITFYAYPMRTTSYGVFHQKGVLHGGAADPLAADLDHLMVDRVLHTIATAPQSYAPVTIPLHLTTLTGKAQNQIEHCFQKWRTASPKQSVMIEILGLTEHFGENRLRQAVQVATSLSKAVTVRVGLNQHIGESWKNMGVKFVGFATYDDTVEGFLTGSACAAFAKRATKQTMLPYILGVGTLQEAKMAINGGFSLLVSNAIGQVKDQPGTTYKMSKQRIIGI